MRTTAVLCVFSTLGCGGDGGGEKVEADDPPSDDEPGGSDSDTRSGDEARSSDDDGSGADDRSSSDDDFIETIDGAVAGAVNRLRERVVIDQIGAYAGFDIELTEALIGQDPVGFDVAQVNVVLTNRTSARARLDTDVRLTWRDSAAPVDRDTTPQLDPDESGEGYYSVRLDSAFDVDDAILFIGRTDRNRIQVPFGSAGELVTRAPIAIDVTGNGSDETSDVELTLVALSWDVASPQTQSEPGSAFLRIEYSLTSAVGTALSDDVLALTLPSGESVSSLAATIETVEAGASTEAYGVFPVDDPATGGYVFRYSERFGNGSVEIPFTVP